MREAGQGKPKLLSPAEINAIKQRIDLVGLIGPHVQKLQQRGKEYVGLCPFHTEATGSFHIIPEKGFYHCFGCGAHGDAFKWLQDKEGLSFGEALAKLQGSDIAPRRDFVPVDFKEKQESDEVERQKKLLKVRELWAESEPAFGTLVETYLASRGLQGVMIPPAIRFHPSLWHWQVKKCFPAMVSCVVKSGKITGIHRTFLREDGLGKIKLTYINKEGETVEASAKMMLGDCHGGFVRLDNHASKLIIAEGIETALAVKMACPQRAVWAALSLTNMDAPVPNAVRDLTLCADGDNKDPIAADKILGKAALSHMRHGRLVRIARPQAGKDFNDMIMGRAA